MSDLHAIPRTGAGEPRADVIFVHGLSGHPYETWQHNRKNREESWPFWLAKEVPEVAVWTLAHDAAWHQWFGRNAMPLTQSALDALGELVRHGIGRVPIGFVCHSLGGLLVKQVLLTAATLNNPKWQPVAEQTRAIAFVGTPHAGADLATLLFRLGRALGTSSAIEDLRAHDSNLMQLNIWYRQNAGPRRIRTLCYFESRKTKVKFLGFLPWGVRVVASGDADPGIADAIPSPLGGDHFAICKPDRRDTRLCHEVAELVREVMAKPPDEPGGDNSGKLEPIIIDPLALPADLSDFQDRGEKQAKLLSALIEEGQAAAITAVGGMGGIGKTTVAIHAARQLRDRFPDGVRYLDLKGISDELEGVANKPLTPLEAMGRIIQSFDEKAKIPDSLDQAGALYRHTLDGKRVLLLLDDARDSNQVRPLLDTKNRGAAAIIVTSRRMITADGLVPIQLDQMSPEEGRGFLTEMIGAGRASTEELDRLAARCGHLPLALRVAGRFLQDHPDWAVREYVDAVNKAEVDLKMKGEKNKDVLAVLGLSAAQLSKEDSSLAARWQMFAAFPDSFDRQAAAAMWAMEDRQARADLSSLVSRSMLLFDAATRRYRLHDLMRDVAQLPLEGEDQALVERRLGEAAARHAQHYCWVLAAADKLYLKGGDNVLEGLKLYDLELRNIVGGQAWAVERLPISARLVADFASAGASILHLRLHPRTYMKDWLFPQLEACRKLGDRQCEGQTLRHLGNAYANLGETRRAINYYEQSLAIACEIGDRRGEGNAFGGLGVAYAGLGEPRRSIEHFEQWLKIAREILDERGVGHALGNLGLAYADLEEPRRAIEYHKQALAISKKIGDRRGEGQDLGNLGSAHAALGATGRAIEYYEQGLAIAREIGDRLGERAGLGNLGNAYFAQGDTQRAIEYYEQSLAIARETGDQWGEGNALFNSARAFDRLGQRDEAIRRMEAALTKFEQIEDPGRRNAEAQLAKWRDVGSS